MLIPMSPWSPVRKRAFSYKVHLGQEESAKGSLEQTKENLLPVLQYKWATKHTPVVYKMRARGVSLGSEVGPEGARG